MSKWNPQCTLVMSVYAMWIDAAPVAETTMSATGPEPCSLESSIDSVAVGSVVVMPSLPLES